MVAMVTVYIISLVYILKIRVVGNFKKCTRPEFLKESHLDKNDVEIWNLHLTWLHWILKQ
jgi:hypothetical protein